MNKTVSLDANDHIGGARRYAIGLGLANRCMQIALLVWCLRVIVRDKSWQRAEAVSGHTQSFVGAGGLYGGSTAAESGQRLNCADTTKYWYHNEFCDLPDALAANAYACEYNITCASPQYAEATKKSGESELYVFTYMKMTRYEVFPCSRNHTCAAGEAFWTQEGVSQCKCWKTSNQFLVGVEQMTLTIKHEFSPLRTLSDSLTAEERSSLRMPTRIFRNALDGEEKKSFRAGESIHATVGQWLRWAGVGLDDVNDKALADYPPTLIISGSDNKPTFRMTGVEIGLEFHYRGYIDPFDSHGSTIECLIVMTVVQGYHSFGSNPIYLRDGDLDGRSILKDRYMRGVTFKISSTGKISEFNLVQLATALTVFVVYYGMAPQVTELIFYCLGMLCVMFTTSWRKQKWEKHSFVDFLAYESSVWRQEVNEDITLDGLHARRLLQTLLIRILLRRTKIQDHLTYQEAVQEFTELLTQSRTATITEADAKNENSNTREKDALRLLVRKLDAKDVEHLMAWLFHVAHPELKETPVEERTISVNRFAVLLGGNHQHPSLADCLTHAKLDDDLPKILETIVKPDLSLELPRMPDIVQVPRIPSLTAGREALKQVVDVDVALPGGVHAAAS